MFQLSDVTVCFAKRAVLSLQSLEIDCHGFTVLLGHNGSGKTTLMNILARQLSPSDGAVSLHGTPLSGFSYRRFAREVAHLPQRLPEVPGLTARELCGLGRFPWRGALGRWGNGDAEAIGSALAETGMGDYADQLVDRLSGGERQRAWIAMLLAQEAPILLLDEPISALDIAHQLEVLELLQALSRDSGRGVIAILHDINLATRFADRILVLKEGGLAFDGVPRSLLHSSLLGELFGARLELIARPGQALPVAVPA